uniref:Uncharacterized protein n=1 Tax=Rhizophagus irregularis (strain DAOM 181602 / DAOM 197198 / MUCL 43194) TaxID=747089 RepID=U9UD25_RHIID
MISDLEEERDPRSLMGLSRQEEKTTKRTSTAGIRIDHRSRAQFKSLGSSEVSPLS